MRIGIFGGTFDPIHFGHLRIAEVAREHLSLEQVLFVPVGAPVHRSAGPHAGREHRYAMCLLATAENPHFRVSRIETEKAEPSYTFDTLRALQPELAGADIYLIVGADEAVAFGAWYKPREILEMARLAVATRPGLPAAEIEDRMPDWASDRCAILPPLAVDISATDIRARLAAGRSVRYLVPDAVRTHIEKYRLYRP